MNQQKTSRNISNGVLLILIRTMDGTLLSPEKKNTIANFWLIGWNDLRTHRL
jgi:hypothetical protein